MNIPLHSSTDFNGAKTPLLGSSAPAQERLGEMVGVLESSGAATHCPNEAFFQRRTWMYGSYDVLSCQDWPPRERPELRMEFEEGLPKLCPVGCRLAGKVRINLCILMHFAWRMMRGTRATHFHFVTAFFLRTARLQRRSRPMGTRAKKQCHVLLKSSRFYRSSTCFQHASSMRTACEQHASKKVLLNFGTVAAACRGYS